MHINHVILVPLYGPFHKKVSLVCFTDKQGNITSNSMRILVYLITPFMKLTKEGYSRDQVLCSLHSHNSNIFSNTRVEVV